MPIFPSRFYVHHPGFGPPQSWATMNALPQTFWKFLIHRPQLVHVFVQFIALAFTLLTLFLRPAHRMDMDKMHFRQLYNKRRDLISYKV